jgi:hypothetical protein
LADPPGEKLVLLDNLGWYFDELNYFEMEKQMISRRNKMVSDLGFTRRNFG